MSGVTRDYQWPLITPWVYSTRISFILNQLTPRLRSSANVERSEKKTEK